MMIDTLLRGPRAALLGGLFFACGQTAWAEEETSRYSVTTGLDYSSGKYGTGSTTDIWFVPVTLKYERGPATVKLTIPYVQISSPSGGTIIEYDDDGHPIYSAGGKRHTEEGLGDVTLTYLHSVLAQPRGGFLVDLGAKVKFPTADEDKGLGSGKADYGAFVDAYYPVGATTPFATLGYRVLGDPSGIELRNVWYGMLGVAYKYSDRNSVGLMWNVRQASTSRGSGMNELTAYWSGKLSRGFKLQAYGVAGLGDGSPDYGLGLMVTKANR